MLKMIIPMFFLRSKKKNEIGTRNAREMLSQRFSFKANVLNFSTEFHFNIISKARWVKATRIML